MTCVITLHMCLLLPRVTWHHARLLMMDDHKTWTYQWNGPQLSQIFQVFETPLMRVFIMFIHFSHQRTATLAPCHSQRNQNVSPDSFCAKFLSGFNLVSETTRLIVEYFLVEEFLNKCCVICMMWIMPGPANTLRTKTTANTKHQTPSRTFDVLWRKRRDKTW